MPTKEEYLVKFASQTGAEIPGIQSQGKGNTDININTDVPTLTEATTPTEATLLTEAVTSTAATTLTENTPAQEDEELFKDSFSDRTKIPLWEDPKFKGIIVALCVLPGVIVIGWIFKDGIPKPNLTKSPRPIPVKQEPDEDKPKDATDGEWASYAATNGMRQQFSDAASDENTDAQKKFQERVDAKNKSQVNSAGVKPNTRPEHTNERTNSVPTYRTVTRSYTPATPVRTSYNNIPEDYTQSSHRVSRSYTPPIQKPTAYRVPPVRAYNSPTLSKPPAVSPTQSLDSSQQQQNSPQERIAAIIAATSTQSSDEPASVASAATEDSSEPAIVTSTGVGNEPAIIASTAIPSRSRAINSGATRSVRSPDPVAHLSSEAAVIDGQPQTLIERSLSAKGTLLTSIAFTAGDYATIANQPVEIELTEALGDIPAGARIVAVVQANQSNNYGGNGKAEVVRLGATALVIGDMEMPLPDGAISLSGNEGAPLIAKRGGSSFRRFVGGLAGTVAGGAGLTNFGASQNVEIGDSSYFSSVGANIATNVVSNAARSLQRSGEGDGILVLKAGSSITISVHKPLVLPDF